MSEVETKSEPTPLAEILDKGRGEGDGVQPSPVRTDTNGPAGDGSSDRESPSEWHVKNLGRALKEERTKRQAYAQRVRELEDENRVLLDAPHAPREEEPPASPHEETLFRANLRASTAEHIAEQGRENYLALDAAVGRAIRAGHPELPALGAAMRRSDNPIRLVMDWAQHHGLLERQAAPRAPVFPSNLASARNVGARSGPAWSGPAPLSEILNRGRK